MAVYAAAVVLVVGLVMLVQAARADRAVRRWTHTRGTVREASTAHLADDGRQWWDVRVSYRTDSGEERDRWVRQLRQVGSDPRGGAVDVWYDPRHPDRCRVATAGNAGGSSWLQYALGLALLVGGAVVLAGALA
jgi:hypothetical protein